MRKNVFLLYGIIIDLTVLFTKKDPKNQLILRVFRLVSQSV
jgi:hypothetical protein